MPSIVRSFEAIQTDGTLNGASVTTGTNSDLVDLTQHEGAHVTIDADFPPTPVDDLTVEVYPTANGGTDYDDTPSHSFNISRNTDPNQVSFIVEKVAGFRVRVKRTGTTNTITVTMKYRRWQWATA